MPRYGFHAGTVECHNLKQKGGRTVNITATGDGDDYTVRSDDYIIGADTNDSTLTVTIPSGEAKKGRVIIINDEGGNASGNNISIDSDSVDIDDSADDSITTDYGTLALYSDGSQWYTF